MRKIYKLIAISWSQRLSTKCTNCTYLDEEKGMERIRLINQGRSTAKLRMGKKVKDQPPFGL